jgi:hypothetical protein
MRQTRDFGRELAFTGSRKLSGFSQKGKLSQILDRIEFVSDLFHTDQGRFAHLQGIARALTGTTIS